MVTVEIPTWEKVFLGEDGVLGRDMMPDLLHLSPKAYALWAREILPEVRTAHRCCRSAKDGVCYCSHRIGQTGRSVAKLHVGC